MIFGNPPMDMPYMCWQIAMILLAIAQCGYLADIEITPLNIPNIVFKVYLCILIATGLYHTIFVWSSIGKTPILDTTITANRNFAVILMYFLTSLQQSFQRFSYLLKVGMKIHRPFNFLAKGKYKIMWRDLKCGIVVLFQKLEWSVSKNIRNCLFNFHLILNRFSDTSLDYDVMPNGVCPFFSIIAYHNRFDLSPYFAQNEKMTFHSWKWLPACFLPILNK